MGTCLSTSMSPEKEHHRFDELNKGYYSFYHESNTVSTSTSKGFDQKQKQKQQGEQHPQDKSEYIRMDKPHLCSYTKKTDYKGIPKETTRLGHSIPRQICKGTTNDSSASTTITPLPVEMRGITLEQLLAVVANMERRCVEEEWVSTTSTTTSDLNTTSDSESELPLTPEQVTWYDLNEYIILPYTQKSEASFVETLPSTAGTQPPRFFISHAWSETVHHTIDCIQQMIYDMNRNYDVGDEKKGGGMTRHTPFWICAFSVNQHQLHDDMGMSMEDSKSSTDPRDLGFAKAMQVANYRTLVVLDKDGTIFTRIWCLFELYISLLRVQQQNKNHNSNNKTTDEVDWNGLWAIYTPYEHTYHGVDKTHGEKRKAVGIYNLPGGATSDAWASDTANRERYFPMRRVLKAMALDHDVFIDNDNGSTNHTDNVNVNVTANANRDTNEVMVQTAKATKKQDEMNILNYISGAPGGSTKYLGFKQPKPRPPKEHCNYDILNDAIRGAFASFKIS